MPPRMTTPVVKVVSAMLDDPTVAGRPARRYYRLTPTGAEAGRAELAARHRRRPRATGAFATAVAA